MTKTDQQAFDALAKTKPVFAYPAAKKVWQAALAYRDGQDDGMTKGIDDLRREIEWLNSEIDIYRDSRDLAEQRAHQAESHLAEVTQQRDELVEAVNEGPNVYSHDELRILAARIQSAQPKEQRDVR
ncbi:MAG: hypothetical protein ACPG4T_15170 [Nannocystaceae bacterium]